ncbi:MAG: hypothetical protein FWD58_00390 [Firmicutes bacterium]|nr:hypothetical protein [Bacillota bacterium]
MKKHKLVLSLLLAAALICAPILFASCDGAKTDYAKYAGKYYAYADTTKSGDTYYELKANGKWTAFAAGESAGSGTFTVKSGTITLTPASGTAITGTVNTKGVLNLNAGGAQVAYYTDASPSKPTPGETTNPGGTTNPGVPGVTEEPGDFNWTLSAVVGQESAAVTTQLKIVLESATELGPDGITVYGAADAGFKIDLLTGKIAADSGMVTESATAYLVPITANYTGNAMVKLVAGGVNGGIKKVAVTGKFTLPDKQSKPLNYKAKPAGYTGTPFVDDTYPDTAHLVPYAIDEATGEKSADPDVNLAAARNFANNYMPGPRPVNPLGQSIPGAVKPAFYDEGGMNVGFSQAGRGTNPAGNANHGDMSLYRAKFRSGSQRPVTSFIKGFYYTSKQNDGEKYGLLARDNNDIVDMHAYGMVFIPEAWMNTLYCGWTAANQWWRMTVNVETTGIYEVRFFYSMQDGKPLQFSLDFDPEQNVAEDVAADAKVDCEVPSTNKPDPTGWRQAHHWNYTVVAYMYLEKGQSVLTTRIVNGGPNVCRFDFNLIG